jgi:hypothetical protein
MAFRMIMSKILDNRAGQRPLPDKDHPTYAFVLHRAHKPLGVRIIFGDRGGSRITSVPLLAINDSRITSIWASFAVLVAHRIQNSEARCSCAVSVLGTLVRWRLSLQLEIIALRHQLTVYQRSIRRRRIRPSHRILWSWISRHWSRPWGRGDRLRHFAVKNVIGTADCVARSLRGD